MGLEQIIPGRLLAWYAGTDEDEPAITGPCLPIGLAWPTTISNRAASP